MSRPEPEYVCYNHQKYQNERCQQWNRNCLCYRSTYVHSRNFQGGELCCSILSFLCIILQSIVFFFSFSIDHCIVCCFFYWPLYCLLFFLLATVLFVVFSIGHCVVYWFFLLATVLFVISSIGHCIVCPQLITASGYFCEMFIRNNNLKTPHQAPSYSQLIQICLCFQSSFGCKDNSCDIIIAMFQENLLGVND